MQAREHLQLTDTQTHTAQSSRGSGRSGLEEEEGFRQGASSSSQAGYLQRPVLHRPGETSPGLRQCLGGAWGPGRWTWTYPPRSRQRTKTHLQRQAGIVLRVWAWPEFRAKRRQGREWERGIEGEKLGPYVNYSSLLKKTKKRYLCIWKILIWKSLKGCKHSLLRGTPCISARGSSHIKPTSLQITREAQFEGW